MAAIMGATYPDLYAAVGVHSGLAPGAANDLSSAFTAMRQGGPVVAHPNGERPETVPTIVFHGDRDTTVHPRNGERLLAHLNTAGGQNGSSERVRTRQGRVPGGYEYTRFSYHDADGRALLERWSVHGLGHAWSGGSYPGSYTDPRGPDASAEMVRFFQQHHKR
jgi:poly(3-hydroxybutyrate) depolymerase